MTREKAESLYPKIKDSVDAHLKAIELLKKLLISIEWVVSKSNDEGLTVEGWERRKAEVLYSAGLGSKPEHIILRERWTRK